MNVGELNNTLRQHEIPCDKCEGNGKNYAPSVAEFLKRWRIQSGVSQQTLAALLKQDKSTLSRFEAGKEMKSEQAIRRYITMLLLHQENVSQREGKL